MGNCNGCESCSCKKKPTASEIIKKYQDKPEMLIPCLQEIQESDGFLSKEVIEKIGKGLNVPVSEVYGVISFYAQFRTTKPAEKTITICTGTACYVLGAADVVSEFEKELGIKQNETSTDGKWRIECARCLGCCGLAPVLNINGKVYGKVKPADVKKILAEEGQA